MHARKGPGCPDSPRSYQRGGELARKSAGPGPDACNGCWTRAKAALCHASAKHGVDADALGIHATNVGLPGQPAQASACYQTGFHICAQQPGPYGWAGNAPEQLCDVTCVHARRTLAPSAKALLAAEIAWAWPGAGIGKPCPSLGSTRGGSGHGLPSRRDAVRGSCWTHPPVAKAPRLATRIFLRPLEPNRKTRESFTTESKRVSGKPRVNASLRQSRRTITLAGAYNRFSRVTSGKALYVNFAIGLQLDSAADHPVANPIPRKGTPMCMPGNLTRFFGLSVMIIMLLGCASIVSKSQYPVTFDSDPSGARLKIVNRAGDTIYEGASPTTLTLEASSGFFRGERYKVVASANGGSSTSTLTPTLDGWYIAGNIVFGGLIGWLIVDPATGAMYKLPSRHTISTGSDESID